ncbi:MAG: acetoacetate decarboxylase [Gammaproteobacteria bacterium]
MQASMPIATPSYPRGSYRFIDREYFIVAYQSDPEAIREPVPEPLKPDARNTVLYEFIRMPDSSGFGDYTESGTVIPCVFRGQPINFTAQMYLDGEPPIAGGREI